MAKLIPLTQGKFAIVDDEHYECLSKYNWFAHREGNTFYAMRSIGKPPHRKVIYMHRQILGLKSSDGKLTDHINHYGLDNRNSNLRLCTSTQNHQNQLARHFCSSKFKGVYWAKDRGYWRSQIRYNDKPTHLGCFDNEIEAALAYDQKAQELFGEFAKTNF